MVGAEATPGGKSIGDVGGERQDPPELRDVLAGLLWAVGGGTWRAIGSSGVAEATIDGQAEATIDDAEVPFN